MMYAEVILPLPLFSTFTYSVPEDMVAEMAVGVRVLVQFGKKKFYTGIVAGLTETPPGDFKVKPIMSLLGADPAVKYPQLKFWRWLADYYLCSIGDVYKAAIPSGLKPESETWLSINPDSEWRVESGEWRVPGGEFQDAVPKLTAKQQMVLNAIEGAKNKKLRLQDIAEETKIGDVGNIANRLLEMGIVEIAETVKEKYRPKTRRMLRLKADVAADRAGVTRSLFALVNRSRLQEKALITFLDLTHALTSTDGQASLSRETLMEKADVGSAVIKAMIDKGIFEEYKETVSRFKTAGSDEIMLSPLSPTQQTALDGVRASMRQKQVTLLHGVTGSGKTEIYTHLIAAALADGNQVLYLVPEISLTTQLTDRLRRVFGKKLTVYHSKFSDAERVEVYRELLDTNTPRLILGARSSVFLPFSHLGLVIVDEEHESSYKQFDPAPRYNARDAAIVLATMHGSRTLLGSATPSIETFYKTQTGKYGLVTLTERFEGAQLPDVEIVDMKDQRKRKLAQGIISQPLKEATEQALAEGRQAILFQNRRGFAPVVVCGRCGWTPKCPNCDVSMVYHKYTNMLRCHYCNASMPLPTLCPACGENAIDIYGYGTERIAEEIDESFPKAKISRMDLDTTRNKDSYQNIIEDFSGGKTDILVGTQMVTKGLDFGKVDIVGVLNADTILNFPDFRSNERAFNMFSQVAGRAGRRQTKGKVFIQTKNPENPILQRVQTHDYAGYYEQEISDRQKGYYPPFTRVINVYIKNKDQRLAEEAAVKMAEAMRQVFGGRVLGPQKPFVSRVALYYLQTIMLKVEAEASMTKVKYILRNIYEGLARDSVFRSTIIYYDVDPA